MYESIYELMTKRDLKERLPRKLYELDDWKRIREFITTNDFDSIKFNIVGIRTGWRDKFLFKKHFNISEAECIEFVEYKVEKLEKEVDQIVELLAAKGDNQ